MRTDLFDYDLPPELIAQEPVPRGASRLLTLDRSSGAIRIGAFAELPGLLRPGDVLVLNDTRVSARRVMGRLADGREVEALLLRPVGERRWDALVRPGRKMRAGTPVWLTLSDGGEAAATVVASTDEGGRTLEFADAAARDRLTHEGVAPLPPYIHARLADEERYQTVYSREEGSAAAPTAGLHFPAEMLATIQAAGVRIARATLHVGVDTFRPVRSDDVESHEMHGEWYSVSDEAAGTINSASGRIVAVGTTSVRALESAAVGPRRVASGCAVTRLFITPGYTFQCVDAMLTNFHLPRSTLLMLISAFAGRDHILAAYREAVANRLRFYSFGDAMFIA